MAGAARRVGAETSATRALIVEATNQLIRDEGYASVSTRRVAARAGLKPSLVHYYFPTTDDLLVEVSRQGAAQSDRMIEEALASDDPLRALWGFFIDTSRVAMALEFMALANHRPAVREYMAQHSEEMRARQVEILKHMLGDRLDRLDGFDAAGFSVVLAGIGRAVVMEQGLGVKTGHAEAIRIVEGWLDKLAA
ncbi:TetR/AcrR family transcriptional regulator [Novosphingobium resinovorum]|uniref:TetR family transcriptional regulator n=1 Tax=Novosphingobium resinovorum TaxID=158500 RepID=A0A031K3T7_9SPHN|nr:MULTISPECIES: TetR/AcrR family transcriptional regulator [Sphingomonadaceae]AOR76644.1 TetR family transcriptional regulator [Novosphingobium resinovorum]EJU12918.1 TetR family transcriptional regulator [Sphingomonas sp. LH128]EZP83854.1 TetR family transcriptional regulator [Novosphingobium resinovorum]MBF7011983.1 TetR/AcrR family transcriptional regulator [Novosphingobium sp. HR1a]WJM26733.1 TetR/AcrR family transcriptional regulator [Novosphingobium resinovorum]